MKKQVIFITQGTSGYMENIAYFRVLPDENTRSVGPFVFLDYIPKTKHNKPTSLSVPNTGGSHPHKGIATLTYNYLGELLHIDSAGNYGVIHSGGAAWFKAGSGAIHDDGLRTDAQTNDLLTEGFQFWINLPARNKADKPDFVALERDDIPIEILEENAGWMKILAGGYKDLTSQFPTYSKQYLYHIHIEPTKTFTMLFENELEQAVYLPSSDVMINGTQYAKNSLLVFDKNEGSISFENMSNVPANIILFGGESYGESIAAKGPFVMNSEQEISEAYREYRNGKYGEINYSLIK